MPQEVNRIYQANEARYEKMTYRRCGSSGVKLPAISLGLWQNFGAVDSIANAKEMLFAAFDLGVTHFDLANNYGPPYGSAEETFGAIHSQSLKHYRDEMFISSKAGYDMYPGPYGDGGSRKYLVNSIDQSLKRCQLDYFDVFYHHRPDPETPLEETMQALDHIVRSGRALYASISNYPADLAREAMAILRELGTPCLLHQARYSMFDRWIEDGLTDVLEEEKVGAIVFSPLAQGLLTNKYLKGIPQDSRAARKEILNLKIEHVSEEKLNKVEALNQLALQRGQSLAQMALAWVLRQKCVASALVGASSADQIKDSVKALDQLSFSDEELRSIEYILSL